MIRQRIVIAIVAIFCGLQFLHAQKVVRVTDYVDPFIGTGGHGHTYPGASYPFGMIQVSPDTRLEGWDGCSGYHASDQVIYGFSHTHLSGTGCSDYGDILLMPVSGTVSLEDYGYASPFHASSEKASPGFYRVGLDKYGVGVELTATKRAGFHRYTFPAGSEPSVVIDLVHRDKVLDAGLTVRGLQEVEGYRISSAWAKEQHVYFVLRFSVPFDSVTIDSASAGATPFGFSFGKHIRALLSFASTGRDGEIKVKIGISAVSIEGARRNLEQEIPGWNFDAVMDETRSAWAKELQKITVFGGSEEQRVVFYTAFYHAMLSPDLYSDVDGAYRGRDLDIHQTDGFDYYTVFSLWDTYRALHPLLTITDQKRTNDFIKTFIRQYEEGGLLPVWELAANETNCMIGYHAIPVIADAYLKGIRDYDAGKALEAMKTSATQDQFGLRWYKSLGFIPGDQEGESVSRTLEYAYDDWCIAMMARAMGRDDDYREYLERAQYYLNLWDASTRFFRAKLNNQWVNPFDPFEVNFHYTEANAWQYSLYVPQDIPGLVRMMGGPEAFGSRLDSLFSASPKTTGRDQADITGLIGQYAHGNEPSHHMAYLYDYIGKPFKTQELVHRIMETLYTAERDGLSGNEDCGQMSAWYVLSALGFYPVTPASGIYAMGTPLFPLTTIRLENGNQFTVRANGVSSDRYYIRSCTLNGKVHDLPFISHEEIMAGGELVVEMDDKPNPAWGTRGIPEEGIPEDLRIQPVPFVSSGETTFFDSTTVAFSSIDPDVTISFSLTDSSETWQVYTGPVTIHETSTFRAYAGNKNGKVSRTIESTFLRIPVNRTIRLNTSYSSQYTAGGDVALIDGRTGGENFKTGIWQGYEGVDLDAVVDLGETTGIQKVSVGFLQDAGSWIFFPTEIRFYGSNDGEAFQPLGVSVHEVSQKDLTPRTLQQWIIPESPVEFRFIRVVAVNPGVCPDWHPGAGRPSWIFADEITVN